MPHAGGSPGTSAQSGTIANFSYSPPPNWIPTKITSIHSKIVPARRRVPSLSVVLQSSCRILFRLAHYRGRPGRGFC